MMGRVRDRRVFSGSVAGKFDAGGRAAKHSMRSRELPGWPGQKHTWPGQHFAGDALCLPASTSGSNSHHHGHHHGQHHHQHQHNASTPRTTSTSSATATATPVLPALPTLQRQSFTRALAEQPWDWIKIQPQHTLHPRARGATWKPGGIFIQPGHQPRLHFTATHHHHADNSR